MKSEWKECTLKEIINFKNGKKKPVEEGIIPVYGGNGVLGYVNQFNLRKGIAIGRVGAYCGSVYYSNKECWISDNAIQAINNNNSDMLFDYYLLKFLRLNERRIGTGQPLLTQEILNRIEIKCPPLQIQRKIASILSILDEKIELNDKINENLEQQAQAIFKNYIDIVDSECITVGEITVKSNTGADAIQKAPIVEENTGIRCVRVGDMSNKRPYHEWGFTKTTEEVFYQYQLHKNDIIVTRTATLGLNMIIAKDLNAVYNNGLIRLVINNSIALPLFVYRQFQTKDFFDYIGMISGETSVRPNMKMNYLLNYEFKLPSIEEQQRIIDILNPIFEKQQTIIEENKYLAELRDTLLPKLMNGEIDVSKVKI